MVIGIVSAVVICFLVGFGSFEWGKSHKQNEILKKQSIEEQNKQKETIKSRNLQESQYKISQEQQLKELSLIKKCLKSYNLPNEKVHCVGVYAMLKEKYTYIPDEKTILHFLKIYILNKIKKQD